VVARPEYRIVGAFWGLAALIAAAGSFAIGRWGLVRPLYSGPFRPEWGFLEMWTRFDGGWYQQIATDGYFYDPTRQSSIVFFPTYPLSLRPLVAVGLNPFLAGFVVTLAATSVAIVAFGAWQRDYRYAPASPPGTPLSRTALSGTAVYRTAVYRTAVSGTAVGGRPAEVALVLAILAWLAYPYSWFLYGAMYSDALFAAVTIGSFWLLERDRPVAAGLLGIAATAARPFGWAVTIGLAVRTLERRWQEQHGQGLTVATVIRRPLAVLRTVRPVDLCVGLSGLGVVAYLGYLWSRFGSPRVFIWNQAHWGQGSGSSILTKSVYRESVVEGWQASPLTAMTLTAQAVIGLGLLTWGTWAVWRRFGMGLALYCAITIAPPVLFTKDFQGIGRYALALFPVFAVVGVRASSYLTTTVVVLAASAAVMVVSASLFARGFYLS
jgi:hypothetical protein